jgi:hypothetical protein
MNPLHQGISSLAAQISFQAARMSEMQSRRSPCDAASRRLHTSTRVCNGTPGILSNAIAQVAEVATFTGRH